MNQVVAPPLPPEALGHPQIRLDGMVGDEMFRTFRDALAEANSGPEPLVLELTTNGGDAETARRIATDIRLFRERTGRRTAFFGKAMVYSAGVTIMSAFPREDRWLSRETWLLVHSRSITETVQLDGQLECAKLKVQGLLSQIEAGLSLQRAGFVDLIAGSRVDLEDVERRARSDWYIAAEEALDLGLIAGVV